MCSFVRWTVFAVHVLIWLTDLDAVLLTEDFRNASLWEESLVRTQNKLERSSVLSGFCECLGIESVASKTQLQVADIYIYGSMDG